MGQDSLEVQALNRPGIELQDEAMDNKHGVGESDKAGC